MLSHMRQASLTQYPLYVSELSDPGLWGRSAVKGHHVLSFSECDYWCLRMVLLKGAAYPKNHKSVTSAHRAIEKMCQPVECDPNKSFMRLKGVCLAESRV